MNYYFKIKNGEKDEKSYLLHEAMCKMAELDHKKIDFVMSTEPVSASTERTSHIKSILKQRSIKTKKFAEDLSYNYNHIVKIFNGHSPMQQDVYDKMCKLLDIEPLK
jgi:hypothetical protein